MARKGYHSPLCPSALLRATRASRFLFVLFLACTTATAAAQTAAGPAIVNRTAADKVTVRTVRLDTPLRIDGRLDEKVYASVEAISEFIQQEPHEGAPATEKTEAWIFFDDANLYIAARCWDSHPEREVATNFTAIRLKRNIFGRSNIGLMTTRRGPAAAGGGQSYTFGADATMLTTSPTRRRRPCSTARRAGSSGSTFRPAIN